MKKLTVGIFLLITISMSSCVYSLFPIYTDETLVYFPELVGKWMSDKDDHYLVLDPLGDDKKGYKMAVYENDTLEDRYTIHLAQIGDDVFMDLYPNVANKPNDNYFPIHTFMKFEIKGDEISLIQFNLEKLFNLFESNLIRIRHEMVDDQVMITAQPKELQKFFDNYADDPEVFDEILNYSKSKI